MAAVMHHYLAARQSEPTPSESRPDRHSDNDTDHTVGVHS